ncbi:MAG TPA: DUF885 family protein [Candidatus Dormibacteraeota bacterium]|nr:DUF885 family protein [Candidatus Dormibacteraeota bacterium]
MKLYFRHSFRVLGWSLLPWLWSGSAQTAQVDLPKKISAAPMVSGTSWPGLSELVAQFGADYEEIGRFYDLPWSSERLERLNQLLDRWQERLASIRFDTLETPARIDYLLLRNKVTAEQARLALERRRLTEMEVLLPFRHAIQDLQQARWRMEPVDPQKAAASVSVIPADLKKLRKRIAKAGRPETEPEKVKSRDTTPDTSEADKIRIAPALARRASSAVDELRRTLKDWSTFYDGFVPEFGWWVKKPATEAQSALESYAKFLREEIAGLKGEDDDPLVGDPIGAEALAADLAAEVLAYSPEELIAIGEREFKWCEARLKEAAAEMGLGEDWQAALAKVKNNFVPPGQQAGVIADKARAAIAFVKNQDLVTIPPLAEELWRLSMLSPDAQRNLPYAAYNGPNMLVAYARDDMKYADKLMSMRGNNPHFMHIVTPHELIPGHHLQKFMSDRHRPYRRLFSTPFYVEGWAVYWEFMLWDRKYGRTPEDRIGMLFWRMHRAARIIVSLKFHLGQMTPAEMVDFIVDRVGHERLGATSEVRRFIGSGYSPLYQCGYMIGGLQLRALRQEIVGAGKLTEKQFNDTVLEQGPIPIEYVRAALSAVPLNRDAKASWRFAD